MIQDDPLVRIDLSSKDKTFREKNQGLTTTLKNIKNLIS